jgi:hypothetical protein
MPTQESLSWTVGRVLRQVIEGLSVEPIVGFSVEPLFLDVRAYFHP